MPQLFSISNLKQWGNNIAGLASITLFGEVLGRMFRYGLSYVIAVQYGAAALGAFTIGTVVLKSGSTFSRVGMAKVGERYISVFSEQSDTQAAGATALVSLALPTVLGTAAVFGIMFFSSSTELIPRIRWGDTLSLFVVGIPLFSFIQVGMGLTRGYRETKYSVYAYDFAHSGGALLLISILGFVIATPRAAAFGYLVSLGIGVIVTVWFLFKLGTFDDLSLDRLPTCELLSYAPAVYWIIAIQYILSWTDIYFLSIYSTNSQIGYYQAAFQTSILVLSIHRAVNSIFGSVAAGFYESNDMDLLRTVYGASTEWVAFVTFQLAVFVLVVNNSVLSLFGAGFTSASAALVLLIVGQVLTALSGPTGNLLVMTENERIEGVNIVLVAILNLGLNFVLIDLYGITGAAAATAFSFGLLNLVRVLEVYYFLNTTPFSRRWLRFPPVVTLTGLVGLFVESSLGGPVSRIILVGTVVATFTLTGAWFLYDQEHDAALISAVK